MALDTYLVLSYTIIDRFGTKATCIVPLMVDSASETVEQVVLDWGDFGSLIDACTDGQIVGGRATLALKPIDGWKASPGAQSFVERTLLWQFHANNVQAKYGFSMPSLANSLIVSGKPDLSSGELHDLGEALTDYGFDFSHASDLNGHALVGEADARLGVRKKRKQIDRSSYEPGG